MAGVVALVAGLVAGAGAAECGAGAREVAGTLYEEFCGAEYPAGVAPAHVHCVDEDVFAGPCAAAGRQMARERGGGQATYVFEHGCVNTTQFELPSAVVCTSTDCRAADGYFPAFGWYVGDYCTGNRALGAAVAVGCARGAPCEDRLYDPADAVVAVHGATYKYVVPRACMPPDFVASGQTCADFPDYQTPALRPPGDGGGSDDPVNTESDDDFHLASLIVALFGIVAFMALATTVGFYLRRQQRLAAEADVYRAFQPANEGDAVELLSARDDLHVA